MNINMLLNVGLGLITGITSLIYYRTVRSWIILTSSLVGFYVAGIYLFMFLAPQELWLHNDFWYENFMRPGFTYVLIVLAANALAGVKRLWSI